MKKMDMKHEKQEMAFMKKKKAPAFLMKSQKKEMAPKKYAKGGGVEVKGKTKGKMV